MSSPDQRLGLQSIIKHDRVRVEAHGDEPHSALPAREGAAGAGRSSVRCKKSVRLLREKDVVHAVEVRCSCGEVTVVDFEYGPQAG